LPLPAFVSGFAFILTGLGLAPVFPAMLHETPVRFGRDVSQRIIGFQMRFGYTGSAFMPPLLGLLMQFTGMYVFPAALTVFILVMLISSERLSATGRKAA